MRGFTTCGLHGAGYEKREREGRRKNPAVASMRTGLRTSPAQLDLMLAAHPELGDLESFRHFVDKAKEYKLEVALDLACQCSPDHPYVKHHPEWEVDPYYNRFMVTSNPLGFLRRVEKIR